MANLNCSLKENRNLLECKVERVSPLLPYFGGKQRIADEIISRFSDHDIFIEPFVGGGSIYFANTIPNKFVINDLNKDVYKVYKTAKDSPQEIKRCNFKINNADQFRKIRDKKIKNGCDVIALHKNGFSGLPTSFAKKNRPMNNNFSEKHIEKLKKTTVLNEDFRKVVNKYDEKGILQYWDPPYVKGGHGYVTNGVTPKEVCETAKKMKNAKVFISYDNHPDVHKHCKGLKFNKIKVPYSARENKIKEELLISN